MFNLTKQYKTKAMGINAIRMTANNKGWAPITTEKAAEFLIPEGDCFVANNEALNYLYGFADKVTTGVALEAVNTALAEQAPKDNMVTKLLQQPSKLEQSKKAVKTEKAENKAPTRCEVKNGARRPLRGKTLEVWLTAEEHKRVTGNVPTCKEVFEILSKRYAGFNKTTCNIQYYACKAYNGWE